MKHFFFALGICFLFLFSTSPASATQSFNTFTVNSTLSINNGDKIILPYTLREKSSVMIWIHSSEGKAIYCMSVDELEAGHYQEQVSTKLFDKGTYFYTLYVNGKLADTIKLTI